MPSFLAVIRGVTKVARTVSKTMAAFRGQYTIFDIAKEQIGKVISDRVYERYTNYLTGERTGDYAHPNAVALLKSVGRFKASIRNVVGFITGQRYSAQYYLNRSMSYNPITNPLGFLSLLEGAAVALNKLEARNSMQDLADFIDYAIQYNNYADMDEEARDAAIAALTNTLYDEFDGFTRAGANITSVNAYIYNMIVNRGANPLSIAQGLRNQGYYALLESGFDNTEQGSSDIGHGFIRGFAAAFGDYIRERRDRVGGALTKFRSFLRTLESVGPRVGIYLDAPGDYNAVMRNRVRLRYEDAAERFIANKRRKLRKLTRDFVDLRLTADEFQNSFASELRQIALAGAIIGAGGSLNLSFAHLALYKEQVEEQMAYLNRFMSDMKSAMSTGSVDVNKFLSRAEMYADSGRSMYRQSERIFMVNEIGGDSLERRVTTPGENCIDCVSIAEQGWQPLGSLPAIGDSRCGPSCKCNFEYSTRGDDSDSLDNETLDFNEGASEGAQ